MADQLTSDRLRVEWTQAKNDRDQKLRGLHDAARKFHTSTFMSGVYAPMLPDLSRNNLWELRRAGSKASET